MASVGHQLGIEKPLLVAAKWLEIGNKVMITMVIRQLDDPKSVLDLG